MARMIPGLDGLRAIAFLLVFALHTDYLQIGWVGVSLFFVLSGYLITGILLDMKKSLPRREYFFKFYGRRFLRIFPLYYFYLILAAIIVTWLISIPYRPRYMQIFLNQVWYAVAYVYDFFFGTAKFQHSNFLDHFWSLSVEEQFYIFWPLLILLVPEKSLKKLFISFIILGPILRLAFFLVYQSGMFRFLADSPALAVYPMPFSHVDAFAFGAYISRYQIPKAKPQFFLLVVLIPIIGFISEYLATGSIGTISALGYPLLLPNAYQFIWAYSLLNYFFAIIIYGVAREGWITRFLEWRPLRYLGKISYGLYVYHFPIVWFAGRLADVGISGPILKPLSALVAFCGTLLLASLSFRFLERPITNLKDRWFPLKPASQPEAAVSLAVEKSTPMINRFKASFTGEQITIAGLLLVGVVLRLRQYLTGRSLWSDEAMLALNIVNRNFNGLFKPLDYDQGSPIGFLLLEKLSSLPFGRSEYALRFFPLILGIASILLFYLLLKRTTGGVGLFVALALFILNPRLIYYSSEVKQYIVDVVATLGLLLLVFPLFNNEPQKRNFVWMAFAGALALWFSHPAFFVLASIGITLVILYIRRRDYVSLRYSIGMGILWLANLIIIYFLVLRDLGHNAYMYEYWQGAFMPLSPWKAMTWFRQMMSGIITIQFGIQYATALVFLLFVVGWVILGRQNQNYAILFAWIFLVTLTASALKLYPFAERMILFLIPIGLLLLGKAVEVLYQSFQKQRVLSVLTALILSGYLIYGPLTTSAGYFLHPKYFEHVHPFMRFLQETWHPGDSMYISNGAVAQFEYYAPIYGLRGATYISNGRDAYINPGAIMQQLNTFKGKSRVWILISHVYEKGKFNEKDFILSGLNQMGEKRREFRVPGTSVYLYLYDLRK